MHSFTLTDADGVAHVYTTMPHPPTEGFAVVSRVAAAAIDPFAGTALAVLMKVVPEAIARARGADGSIDVASILDDPEIAERLGGLDFSGTGPALKRAVVDLNLDTVKLVLKHTSRDDKPLGPQLAFDTAFCRNYGEMAAAVWEVCQYNRFFPLLGGFGDLAEMGKALLRPKVS